MKKKILIVDHDSAFATILKETLESLGEYEARIAATGEEALSRAVEEQLQLVIVDMGLRDVEPGGLIQALRELKPHLKVLAIPLGDSPIPDELRVDGIIPKPFFVGELPAILEKATSQREEPVPPPVKEVKETPRWLSEIQRELSPELLVFGDSSPRFWAGGKAEEASELFRWVVRTLDEGPCRHACPAEIYYRSEKMCVYGTKFPDGNILALAFPREVPLGMIRLAVKKREEVAK